MPEFVAEEVTGQYEGPELAEMRAKRPTDKRLAHLETKHDELSESVGELREGVARIEGRLESLPRMLDLLEGKQKAAAAANANAHETERLKLTTRGKVIIAIVGAITTGLGLLGGMGISGCS